MNKLAMKLAIGAAGLLIIGGLLGFWIAKHRADSTVGADAMQEQGGRRVLYWHDPMYPNTRFDKPGRSPFMDMQLVPVYADEQGNGAAVSVDPKVVQNLGIRTAKVEKISLQPKLSAVGSVAFDERLVEVVQARVEGYITELCVKAPLERVKRGQALGDIISPAWLEAQQEYLALIDAKSDRGQSIRDAARERLLVLGVPETTVRDIETQRKTNAATTLFSPTDGVVSELAVREGTAFMPGATLFRINGLKTVWANAQVPESQVSMIPVGSAVSVRATAWPDETFKGRVLSLLPDVDPQTRTLPVRIEIDNPAFKLAPGMFISLVLEGKTGAEQLVVPSEAVIMTGERSVVIIAREGGGFDVANVTVGSESDGNTVVLSGLQEGQTIVVSGQFLIDSEASLRSTVSRLSAEPTP